MCIGNIRVENANQRYLERLSVTEITFHAQGSGIRCFYLENEKSRNETFGIQIGCLSSLPCHFFASRMQSVGDRGLRKRKKIFSTSGQSLAPGLGLRTKHKYTQGLTFSGCGTTWKTNHLVLEWGLLGRASSIPGPLEEWAPWEFYALKSGNLHGWK